MNEVRRKARILVVEDESIVALDMRNRLQTIGYEVVGIAGTGAEAQQLNARERPDLILMDIKLRGDIDGVQTAEAIRRDSDVPVIFITAFSDERTLARAKITQAFGYILKPFQEREVLISIEMALYKHRLERDLRESREWLDGTLHAIADGVIAVDGHERVVFLNHAAERMLGRSDAAARGRPLDEICAFRPNPALSGLGTPRPVESDSGAVSYVMLESAALKLPVELTRTAILPGSVAAPSGGWVYSLRDLSSLVAGEQHRSRWAAIVADSLDSILGVDADLRILYWNRGAERTYGYAADEIVGSSLASLAVDESDGAALRALAAQVMAGENGERMRSRRRCRSGAEITVSLRMSPVRDAEGRVVELACIERDVSAEMERESALIRSKLAAEETSRVKSEFLSNMSHELRTPLNSIIGMIDLVRSSTGVDLEAESLDVARASAGNLLFLINSILDFSKIEAGKMPIRALPFDPSAAVADSVEELAIQAHQKGVELIYRADPALPSLLIGDAPRYQQILVNLLSNAIKFTERGYVRVDLRGLPAPNGQARLELAVEDTGIGIPADRLETIWEQFTQVDGSATRSYGGTGLGLSIVRSLCALMGGSVRAESVFGRGSRFVATLPFPVADGSTRSAAVLAALQGRAVAVAGPAGGARESLLELLAAWGCRAQVYDTGAALAAAWRSPAAAAWHALVIDEGLSGRSALFNGLGGGEPEFGRLLLLVGVGGRVDSAWSRLGGAPRRLVKPVRRESLLAALTGPPAAGAGGGALRNPAFAAAADGSRSPGAAPVRPTPAANVDEWAAARAEFAASAQAAERLEAFVAACGDDAANGEIGGPRLESYAESLKHELEALEAPMARRLVFKLILANRRGDAAAVRRIYDGLAAAVQEGAR